MNTQIQKENEKLQTINNIFVNKMVELFQQNKIFIFNLNRNFFNNFQKFILDEANGINNDTNQYTFDFQFQIFYKNYFEKSLAKSDKENSWNNQIAREKIIDLTEERYEYIQFNDFEKLNRKKEKDVVIIPMGIFYTLFNHDVIKLDFVDFKKVCHLIKNDLLEDLLEDNNFISSSEFIMNNIKNKLRHWAIYYEHNQFNHLEDFYLEISEFEKDYYYYMDEEDFLDFYYDYIHNQFNEN